VKLKLRRHNKLALGVLIVLIIVGGLLAIAQDQVTLRIVSPHAAEDPFSGIRRRPWRCATGGNSYAVTKAARSFRRCRRREVRAAPHQLRDLLYNSTLGRQFARPSSPEKRGVAVQPVVDAIGSNKIPKEWQRT
jgi:hypothetical protein